jgi:transposase InsO family protein
VALHSDNGSPMKGATLLATVHDLGVMPSFSRPSVSNDNPYSESLFRTLKYRPEYLEDGFADLLGARTCTVRFNSSPQRTVTPASTLTSWRVVRRSTAMQKHDTRNAGVATSETANPLVTCTSIRKTTRQKSR